MRVVCDIETNALEDPTNVWCICCKDIDTGETYSFRDNPVDHARFTDFSRGVGCWIGHNFISFDYHVLRRLRPKAIIKPHQIIDTLVVGRLVFYSVPGGHSLDAWGQRFGYEKSHFDDFSKWSPELEDRCATDVEINHKVYEHFAKYIVDPRWASPMRIEHNAALELAEMHNTGFYYNKEEADKLYIELTNRLQQIERGLSEAFPPRARAVREITPRETKHGTLHRQDFRWLGPEPVLDGFAPGNPFTVIDWQPFNPGSPSQVVERLDEAGWKPIERTKSGSSWRVSEANLESLPADAPAAAGQLVQWLLLSSRVRRLEEWAKAYNDRTHRIHGRVTHIGSWTQRCAHTNPNMGNVPSLSSKYQGKDLKELAYEYGKRLRSLWMPSPGYTLVGCDAEGIQLRLFAHFIDDNAFTHAVVAGNKEDGTDAHSLNAQALGEGITRDQAKTFIYSFLLGAGVGKAAHILGVSMGEAEERRAGFIAKYPGLQELREERIPRDVRNGYFIGIDGRKVYIPPNKREGNVAGYILGGYLQNGESVIMKAAMHSWIEFLKADDIDFHLLNFIHDEWQTETRPETSEHVGRVQAASLKNTGLRFNLRCPMAGEYRVGANWYETH